MPAQGTTRDATSAASPRRGRDQQHEILRAVAIDVPLLFAAKMAVGLYVLSAGFTHVSDDDYARVVIAQEFAHHPALDPSGTSWLPFPFWVAGGAMRAFGSSLEVARVVAGALGVLSVAAPYAALRAVGCGRATALVAVGVALAIPWSAWLGVATVPEAPTACLVAAGVIAVTSPPARVTASFALLVASLSRYEAWPACAVFAAVCLLAARKGESSRASTLAASAVALIGPISWMLWNAHAHGSPLHFIARVTSYRQAIGAAAIPVSAKLGAFPLALASVSPAVLALAVVGGAILPFDETLRRRWVAPLIAAAAIFAFLIYGDVRDGAPTHHPERAVLPIVWILAPFAADALRTFGRKFAWARPQREMWLVGLVLSGGLAWLALLPGRLRDAPGLSGEESRSSQLARGRQLAWYGKPGGHWSLTPCSYEHFALIAAYGWPERFTILPSSHAPVTADCPRLDLDE
ncbi:MAG: hypothetical protein ACLQVI_42910 [Polyangiaceae bacterium]